MISSNPVLALGYQQGRIGEVLGRSDGTETYAGPHQAWELVSRAGQHRLSGLGKLTRSRGSQLSAAGLACICRKRRGPRVAECAC